MKLLAIRPALLAAVALIGATASAQTLKPNETFGFGNNEVLKFFYNQSFDCIDQPYDDLNFNGIIAANDPNEMQTPICQSGTNPTINPPGQPGNPLQTTEPLFVLIPLFSADNDQNPNDAIPCSSTVVQGSLCGSALGAEMITLFGALPEAFKAKPLVYTQCPEPGSPAGTCTMHASRVDLGPTLVQLGYVPPPVANVFVPTPNHSHVVINADINVKAIWWQVIPVLVTSQNDWPSKDGSTGITSQAKLEAARAAGTAIPAPSNFFLFFSSYVVGGQSMQGMNH